MTNSPKVTKTCSSCGVEKSLSAFIQMAGAGGAIYGSICSSCRKTNMDKTNPSQGGDDTTISRTKLTLSLDAKAKAQIEHDIKQQQTEAEESNQEEREKLEKLKEQFREKRTTKYKEEQKHRDKKDRASFQFLNTTKPVIPTTDNSPAAQAAKEMRYETTNSFTDTYIPKLKYTSSPEFAKIQALFGPSAAISKLANSASKVATNKTEKTSEKKSENKLTEDIKNNFPGNTRRR